MDWTCSKYGGEESCMLAFCREILGKETLGRPKHRWEDNIEMDLHEVGCRSMDWIDLSQNRDRWRALANAIMNFRVP